MVHVAADYRLWIPDPQDMYRANVDGTRELLRMARETGVKRFVYTSSVATMHFRTDGLVINEDTPVSIGDMVGHYKRSKFLAEQEALAAAQKGQKVVILNPTTPIGPNDAKPTPTGRIFVDFLNGKFPAYVDTGLNLVDVGEIARMHVIALTRGKFGRRYILGGENLTLKQILDKMSAITGIPFSNRGDSVCSRGHLRLLRGVDHGENSRPRAAGHIGGGPYGTQKNVRFQCPRPAGTRPPYLARVPRHEGSYRVVPRARLRPTGGCACEIMTRTAIIAALPGELKPLVRGWPHGARSGVDFWAQRDSEDEWIAACAGAGQAAATRAFAAIEDGGPIDLIFSVGWAGSLLPEIEPGTAHNLAGVIDVQTGERFRCDAEAGDMWLVTSPKVCDEAEKRRLAAAYKAGLVDMEAAAIGRLAAMRGIPFYCIKGVSDGLTARLPDFNRFLTGSGKLRMGQLVLFAILRPWYWPALIEMGENSKKAAQNIADSLLEFLR